MKFEHAVLAFVLFMIAFCFGIVAGKSVEKNRMEKESIEAGAAEYIITDNMGTTEFRWKTSK